MSIPSRFSLLALKNWINSSRETPISNEEKSITPTNNYPTPNYYGNLDLQLLDPTIKSNALKILNMQEIDLSQELLLNNKYEKALSKLTKSQEKLPPLYAQAMRQRIENLQIAYRTLQGIVKN